MNHDVTNRMVNADNFNGDCQICGVNSEHMHCQICGGHHSRRDNCEMTSTMSFFPSFGETIEV